MDLSTCTGVEALEWMASTFRFGSASSEFQHRPQDVYPILRAGVTDTDLIVREATRSKHALEAWRACPAGALSNDDDLALFALIGPRAYLDDPENREDWAIVARLVAEQDAARERNNRRAPDGRHRYHYSPWMACEAFMAAGRGPAYARRIVEVAARHREVDIDAFGFDGGITPARYDDLLTAGIRNLRDLDGYYAAGLTTSDAMRYRGDGIPPAALLLAKAEGHDPARWYDLLHGLPVSWFRDLSRRDWNTDETLEGVGTNGVRYTTYLSALGNDCYAIADLRYLAEHGWDESASLTPEGLIGLTPDLYAQTARTLADHGMTWADMDRWAKALSEGKAGQERYTTTTPALLYGRSHQRGHGRNYIRLDDLDRVFPLVDRGLKATHMGTYRKAGCRSPEQVVQAFDAGIDPKRAEALLAAHGRKPTTYRSTRLIDSFATLLRVHEVDQTRHAEDATA